MRELQLEDVYYRKEWGFDSTYHRKDWEWVFIAQVLSEQNMLTPGKRGLGFSVGCEPLPALFAKHGVAVTATDLDEDNPQAESWKTNQHSVGLSSLEYPEICDNETLHNNVTFMPLDMSYIPDNLRDFDFCWSSCAFEHLETVQHGREFILNTLKLLKPGGISVHTTEFNLSSEDNAGRPYCNVFGKKFFEELQREIVSMGHYFAPLDYRLGDHSDEDYVYNFEGTKSPFKLWIDGCIATSIGIIIIKS